jgi:peptidyl-prolyl cis-trans isomerase D
MIENLRKYTGLIIIVVALLFVGLVFFEGSARQGGPSGEPAVLAVDGRQYSASEVSRIGTTPRDFASLGSIQLAIMLGSFGQEEEAVKRAFVNRLHLREAAEAFGVHPSKEQIAAKIKEVPAFMGPDGAYDPQKYSEFIEKGLSRNGLTEQDYLDVIRDSIAAEKLSALFGSGLAGDREFASRQVISTDQQVTVQVAKVELAKFKDELKPTEEELKTEWQTTKDKYLTDRRIKVSYLIIKPTYPELPPEEAKLPAAVTDEQKKEEEAKAAEKKAAAEAKLAEQKREVDTALADQVDAFLSELEAEGGKNFESLAKENGWEVVATDFFARAAVPPALAVNTRSASSPKPVGDLLFQLTKSDEPMTSFTDAVPIADGAFVIARLDETEEERTKTFEEAMEQVRTDYIATKAADALKKDADEKTTKLREAVAAGKSFADAAKELGLEVKSHGPFKQSDNPPDLPDAASIYEAAALVDPGTLADPMMRPDGATFVFVEKREIVKDPARDERIEQTLTGLTSSHKQLAFTAWLEEKLDTARIEDLRK